MIHETFLRQSRSRFSVSSPAVIGLSTNHQSYLQTEKKDPCSFFLLRFPMTMKHGHGTTVERSSDTRPRRGDFNGTGLFELGRTQGTTLNRLGLKDRPAAELGDGSQLRTIARTRD